MLFIGSPAEASDSSCAPALGETAGGAKHDRIAGSLLALALGDAFGAAFEGGWLERAFWALIGRAGGRRRWTDDTQMTLDLIESLIASGGIDQNDLAGRFARSYRWSRGYGQAAARTLKQIRRGRPWEEASRSVYREGSFGNGAAMRAPAVGLFFADRPEEELVRAASDSALVTHGHPLARQGAVLIALATALAYGDADSFEIIGRLTERTEAPEFREKLGTARKWLAEGGIASAGLTVSALGNGVAALHSCVTAIYTALAFRRGSYDQLLSYVISLGGDVDTIGAMTSAIWGAARGLDALPQARLAQLEQTERLLAAAQALAEAAGRHAQVKP